MQEGLSTNRHCHPMAECLVREGMAFVIRYHSRTTKQPQKRISPQEAAHLARAGLAIATVYQDNGRLTTDFGFDRGRLDGASAQTFAMQIGQGAGSAVYFAVDTDFSKEEIRTHVLPYFRGVKAGMDEAAGGRSLLTLGVYGSGLTCRMVRDDAGLARWAWLAEATGWRESRTYTAWDVRQHRNTGQTVCDLGDAWQRCEARDEFGQFRPVGFEVRANQGRLMRVSATRLNVRDVPTDQGNVPRAKLVKGHLVRVLGEGPPPWLRIRTTLDGGELIGFVSGAHLEPLETAGPGATPPLPPLPPAPPAPPPAPPAVHFGEGDPRSRRASAGARARPIGEQPRPQRDAAALAATRVGQLHEIGDWLAVESSARYQREPGKTFCNVYAADFCYLAGIYLPRCWWNDAALMRIARGETLPAEHGITLREMRADDLFRWLQEWGTSFGWRRVFDLTALQDSANGGGVGVIVADNQTDGAPGHISIVVPERLPARARRDPDGNVLLPLQSQAGARNFRASVIGKPWWLNPEFGGEFVFYVHD